MKKTLLALALSSLSFAALAQETDTSETEIPQDDAALAEQQCTELKAFEADINPKLPQRVDNLTEVFRILVNCETKSVTYEKRVAADRRSIAVGFGARKQPEHTALHCSENGLARAQGWTAIDVLYDSQASRLATLVTAPKDCPAVEE
ncbi:hypothetical protein [Actibacterium sp. 188UL27-1]|uniref:hypothetical protein n=1 Tax=Actibacterium sp. 188UL27-1 TaxID=2786961 RepID=UPI00195B5147|nr:hypothetical protein [Actibacterium sp. 188UL27-1]MBM7069644.1 hypothetical protein [Actibacterium sp. 188UL27-1]